MKVAPLVFKSVRILDDAQDAPEEAQDLDYGVMAKSAERQYTFGVVYSPSADLTSPIFDAHNEFIDTDLLQTGQWDYVRSGDRNIYLQHGLLGSIQVIGEWVDIVTWPFPVEISLFLPTGERRTVSVPAGSVWMGVVWNDIGWPLVKSGQIRGFSMGGFAARKARPDLLHLVRVN